MRGREFIAELGEQGGMAGGGPLFCRRHLAAFASASDAKWDGDEITKDYNEMIYAKTPEEIERYRKAFIRKWRLKHEAVVKSLDEAGDRGLKRLLGLVTFWPLFTLGITLILGIAYGIASIARSCCGVVVSDGVGLIALCVMLLLGGVADLLKRKGG
jgi:hypothetical protein